MGTPVRSPSTGDATRIAGQQIAGVMVGSARLDRRHQHLPVAAPWSELLPDGGLVRGRTVACIGPAAVSAALGLVAVATARGSWLAIVGLPWVGVEAAREAGVALERVVRVDVDPPSPACWTDRVAAAVDGFDVVLTQVPRRAPDRAVRRVQQRLQARGAVLVDVCPERALLDRSLGGRDRAPSGVDLVVETATGDWRGLERGAGHLRGRDIEVVVTGRRAPAPRRSLWTVPSSRPA